MFLAFRRILTTGGVEEKNYLVTLVKRWKADFTQGWGERRLHGCKEHCNGHLGVGEGDWTQLPPPRMGEGW